MPIGARCELALSADTVMRTKKLFVPDWNGSCPRCEKEVAFAPTTIFGADRTPLRYYSPLEVQGPAGESLTLMASACPACGQVLLSAMDYMRPCQAPVGCGDQLWPPPYQSERLRRTRRRFVTGGLRRRARRDRLVAMTVVLSVVIASLVLWMLG